MADKKANDKWTYFFPHKRQHKIFNINKPCVRWLSHKSEFIMKHVKTVSNYVPMDVVEVFYGDTTSVNASLQWFSRVPLPNLTDKLLTFKGVLPENIINYLHIQTRWQVSSYYGLMILLCNLLCLMNLCILIITHRSNFIHINIYV